MFGIDSKEIQHSYGTWFKHSEVKSLGKQIQERFLTVQSIYVYQCTFMYI